VIEYRTFCNTDPPKLIQVWNESFTGRGAVKLPMPTVLEEFVFAKPYFDPAGLILAVEENTPVGFVHAGFASNDSGSALATDTGVICAIGVRPSYRRRGIGSELLCRAESYLTGRGASVIVAGGVAPNNPFYFGLYGGAESSGFLASDAATEPFLARAHFQPAPETHLVFQRRLEGPVNVADARFPAIRRKYELVAMPHRGKATWYREAALGPIELLDAVLREKTTGQEVARASAWEMVGFCQRWGVPAVGIVDLQVRPELRRQGLAKFLMVHLMRYIQEQFFSLIEVQAPETNTTVVVLYRGLGFERVDTARTYRKA
jgi:ribosomal protein S18 acetylase RimI-like enzyme